MEAVEEMSEENLNSPLISKQHQVLESLRKPHDLVDGRIEEEVVEDEEIKEAPDEDELSDLEMPPLISGSQNGDEADSSQESHFSDFPECDESPNFLEIPQFLEAKPFKDKGSVNLSRSDRQLLMKEIRKQRPNSIF